MSSAMDKATYRGDGGVIVPFGILADRQKMMGCAEYNDGVSSFTSLS